jgi:glyoxylase-like metal-dependent hydrolase (beta-lactamase superfamily II)
VEQWVPALGYLVRHPTEGAFLMDAGMPVADASGHCDFGIPVFFHAPCRAAAGQDLASQLRADHVDLASLRFILMSHLHGDHVGGLHALAAAGPVHLLLRREEWDAASRPMRMFDGYIHELLDGPYSVSYLPMDEAVTMPLVGTSLDLFGDGSVWVFPATGHTRGELAVLLNAQEGPLLFTFDSSHLRENFQSGIAPGFTVDRDAARSALARLAALRHAFPAMHVIYGHEPTQWAQLPRRVPLTGVPFPLSD